MKNSIYSSIFAFVCITASVALIPNASGKNITSDVAQTVAANFFKQNANAQVNTVSLAYTETSASGEAVYFAFNVNYPKGGISTGKGFVIIVADDAQHPVIGYSTEGFFVVPELSSNPGYWMEQRKNEIIANRAQNVQATAEISAQWAAYINGNTVAPRVSSTVAPLLQTDWTQNYNALCPAGTPTGCNATAMAQIMNFWKWPNKGTGSNSYNCPGYGTLSANFGATTYNWNNINIDTLMYQIGVSLDMQYAQGGSSSELTSYDNPNACAQISFSKYFGYYPTYGFKRSNYTDQQWLYIIEGDLNLGHPLEYGGLDPSTFGHGWVCDGYDATNNIHMNWGWGFDDGYFSIDALNVNGNDFAQNNEIVADIRPNATAGIPTISNDELLSIYPNPASNQITIHTSSSRISATTTVSITNVLGQEAFPSYSLQWKGTDATIDVSKLPSGIYFLEMKTESGIDTKMFVKE